MRPSHAAHPSPLLAWLQPRPSPPTPKQPRPHVPYPMFYPNRPPQDPLPPAAPTAAPRKDQASLFTKFWSSGAEKTAPEAKVVAASAPAAPPARAECGMLGGGRGHIWGEVHATGNPFLCRSLGSHLWVLCFFYPSSVAVWVCWPL